MHCGKPGKSHPAGRGLRGAHHDGIFAPPILAACRCAALILHAARTDEITSGSAKAHDANRFWPTGGSARGRKVDQIRCAGGGNRPATAQQDQRYHAPRQFACCRRHPRRGRRGHVVREHGRPSDPRPGQRRQDARAARRRTPRPARTGPKKIDEYAEAEKLLGGPAANPECMWLGRRVVSLLWRDDLDTAFRHLDLYDRFGCPAGHIQTAFRCVVRQGNIDPKAPDALDGAHPYLLDQSQHRSRHRAAGGGGRRRALPSPVGTPRNHRARAAARTRDCTVSRPRGFRACRASPVARHRRSRPACDPGADGARAAVCTDVHLSVKMPVADALLAELFFG